MMDGAFSEDEVLACALRYATLGHRIFPCKPDKTPLVAWKDAATTEPDTIRAWWTRSPAAMIGLPTGNGLAVVDVDVDKETGEPVGEQTARSLGLAEAIAQGLQVRTPSGGRHAYFCGTLPTKAHALGPRIDTRGEGGYVIAPGSANETGTYVWEGAGLGHATLPMLPSEISAALDGVAPITGGNTAPTVGGLEAGQETAGLDEVREIVSWIDPDTGGYQEWCDVLMGLHAHFGGSEAGLSLAEAWSSRGAKYRAGEVPRKWKSFQPRGGVGFGTVCVKARSAGADLSDIARRHRPRGRGDISLQRPAPSAPKIAETSASAKSDGGGDGLSPYSDDALAVGFAKEHSSDLRFVSLWGRWLRWDGTRWAFDDTLGAYDQVRRFCRSVARTCGDARLARELASAKKIAAIERLARSDRALAATVCQWDADPWLLNTPAGVVDLRTGLTGAHRPEGHHTRITAAAPGGTCPIWQRFLADVTGGDASLQLFLQRFAGYALTGSTREQSLAFLHGTGGNGKSVFTSSLAGLMGDYHKTAPMETFTASTGGERHPTDLAMLRGARLVTSVETEEGRRWAESRIKVLTGGDPISARYMRQDFFEFTPQFKLMIAGNHKPGLRSVDEAIRRRLHLVPFTVTIPPEKRDFELERKLRAEWPGILAWAIEGCLAWQQIGLKPPETVRAATTQYLDGQDAIGAWIDECCDTDADAWCSKNELYRSWKAWADRNGEFVLPRGRFAEALESRGFEVHRRNTGGGYRGLCVSQVDYSDAHWNQ